METKGTIVTEQDVIDCFNLLKSIDYNKVEKLTPQQVWDRYYKNLPLFDTDHA